MSVDPVERNAELASSLGLGFRLAADPTLAAIDAYDLRHQDPGMDAPISRPATFVIDANGVVRWRDLTENFRLRPHPDQVLAALDALAR